MADWKVGAARDLAVELTDSWDGQAAQNAIFSWAGFDDNPEPAKARRAFLFYDADAPDLRGGYKAPFARPVGGNLRADSSGVSAALGRLEQTNGPSADQKDTARAILESYQKKAEDAKEKAPESEGRSGQSLVLASAAAVVPVRSGGHEADDLMERARDTALDPSIFDDAPPFFWRAQISNNRLDTYGTKMHTTSLKNYAQDAEAGVSFQNSHRIFELPFGRSVVGRFYGAQGNGIARTEADFYTLPGLTLNGVSTDDLIRGMRSGIVKDVSIGFWGGTQECSECGRSVWDWDCEHIPMTYGWQGVAEEDESKLPAFVWVKNAHLAETSSVYDGATPGAAVMKARMLAEQGRIRPQAARYIEARYRVALPAAARIWTPGRPGQEGLRAMNLTDTRAGALHEPYDGSHSHEHSSMGTEDAATHTHEHTHGASGSPDANHDHHGATTGGDDPGMGQSATTTLTSGHNSVTLLQPAVEIAEMRALLAQSGVAGAADGDVVAGVRLLVEELGRLRPLADDGRAYRADLIEEALREGVRAHGEAFAQETYRAVLAGAPLATIKQMTADWRAAGDRFFQGATDKPGGRLVNDGPAGQPPRPGAALPDAAYRS